MKLSRTLFLISVFAVLISGCAGIPDNVKPVSNFNVEKYMGKWYVVARLDGILSSGLEDSYAIFSMNKDGNIKVEKIGYSESNKQWDKANGTASVEERGIGQLSVSFLWPFRTTYNIIILDEDYQYAAVCGETKSKLLLLSRNITIPEDVLHKYLKELKKAGFSTDDLVYPQQIKK